MDKATNAVAQAKEKVVGAAGGPARLQVISLLALILALDTADKGTVSAVGTNLKQAFDIGNTAFGLLLAIVSFAGAIGTIPMGILVDRRRRKSVLLWAIAIWCVAMAVSGTAQSYIYLLLTRAFLGLVTAAAWPAVGSLTGDFFPPGERAAIFGMILSGELAGVGVGYFVSGEVASFFSWRWSFYTMAFLSLLLGLALWRWLPEPSRGTQAWLEAGETDPAAASENHGERNAGAGSEQSGEAQKAQELVKKRHIPPREDRVLHQDPAQRGWIWALRYCLSIPSYTLLIVASALAYYFFSGVRAFIIIYFTGHYGIAHSTVSALVIVIGLGAVIGVIGGGRLSEYLLRKGRLTVRITIPAIALTLSVPFLALGIWVRSLWIGIPALTAGAAILAAAVAPIDAARLDILHPRLWGRGEAGRMALRGAFEGTAPILFGAVSGWLGGGNQGLQWTLLIMLVPMVGASLFVLPGRKTYPRDIATAAASVAAVESAGAGQG